MRLDPFRIQILTLSLDSQIVLTLVGLVVAGLVLRQAARQERLDLSSGHWWDLVFTMAVGGRVVWVVTHADYYIRQPPQILGLLDGGLDPIGLAIGALFWIWRSSRAADAPPWRIVVDLVAIGVLTAYLFERVGCALTSCGTGPASALPWAILRGDAWHAPMALAQVVVLAIGLMLAAETVHLRGVAFISMFVAFMLIEAIAYSAGRGSIENAVTLTALTVTYASSSWYSRAAARY